MKKVFMTVAAVAMMFTVAACGNKAQKAEATVEETVEEIADSTEVAIDSLAAAAEEIAEEVIAE